MRDALARELRPGSEVFQVTSVLDLLPMLARVAGGKPGSAKPLDGIDLWPEMRLRTINSPSARAIGN